MKDDEKARKPEANLWSTITAGMGYLFLLALVLLFTNGSDLLKLALLLWVSR